MSLATRCTSCTTAFRVVQDQLKVSEGWVRCGRCGEVFNALEGLFDLDRETPPEWQHDAADEAARPVGADDDDAVMSNPTTAEPRTSATAEESGSPPSTPSADERAAAALAGDVTGIDAIAAADVRTPAVDVHSRPAVKDRARPTPRRITPNPESAADAWSEEADVGESSIDEEIDAHLFGARSLLKRRAPGSDVNERDRLDFSDARFASDLLEDETDDASNDTVQEAHDTGLPLESAMALEFLRRAEAHARWQRPAVRASLAAVAVLLIAALALQMGNHFRDSAAVRWPTLRPLLAEWCALAACTIEAPRRIDDINVESTALARAAGTDAFRLAVTLRNRSNLPVSMPWIDLSLTDADGKLLARKAVAARDFTPAATVLPPGAEMARQTVLRTGDAQVSGYTVEIFYP